MLIDLFFNKIFGSPKLLNQSFTDYLRQFGNAVIVRKLSHMLVMWVGLLQEILEHELS